MNALKKVLIALESLLLIGILVFGVLFIFPRETSVDHILSVVDIDLPQYKIISKEIKWTDHYDYKISFPTEYSESIIKQFKNKEKQFGRRDDNDQSPRPTYKYDGAIYYVHYCICDETSCEMLCTDNTTGDYYYNVDIKPQEGTASLSMSYDFGEQFYYVVCICGLLFLGLCFGCIYIIIWFIIRLSHLRNQSHKNA